MIKDIESMSFSLYHELKMDEEGRIGTIGKEVPNKLYVVYAIIIDEELAYIGKTSNLKKRINYYRTALNRKDKTSDSVKSEFIHLALISGKSVKFYARQCFNIAVKNDVIDEIISTMDIEEPMFIKMYNPPLNKQHKRKKNGK